MASIPAGATIKGAIHWATDPVTKNIIAVAPVTVYDNVMGSPIVLASDTSVKEDAKGAPFVFVKGAPVTITEPSEPGP